MQSIREVDIVQQKSKDAEQEPDFQGLPLYQPKGSPDSVGDQADLRKRRNDRAKDSQLSTDRLYSIQPTQVPSHVLPNSSRGAAELPFLGGGIQGRSIECGQGSAGVASRVLPGGSDLCHIQSVCACMPERGRPTAQGWISYAKHVVT